MNEMPARGPLRVFHGMPEGLLDAGVADLAGLLGGPALIDVEGRGGDPLFVSVLQHGNEHAGFLAVRNVLRRHESRGLPRPLCLFIGNVEAAARNLRKLPGQLDFNRAWPGTRWPDAPEAKLLARVVDEVRRRGPFASVDIHTNTGLNPHYACVNRLAHPYFHLARLFSRTVVFFERPRGVQSAALARLCPAVTVECGRNDDSSGVVHAEEFIDACLHLSQIPTHPIPQHDIDLLRTRAIVRVPPEFTISFDGTEADVRFRHNIEELNFSEIDRGTILARTNPDKFVRLEVLPGRDSDAVDGLLDYPDGEIRMGETAIPSMLSSNVDAVRQDCLCYFMRRIDIDNPS